jgi:hypothetical protein
VVIVPIEQEDSRRRRSACQGLRSLNTGEAAAYNHDVYVLFHQCPLNTQASRIRLHRWILFIL